ncbi:MAG: hypothetical protein LBK75_07130 [Oscillospiraceae bacterium]|jgi:Leucine-rich repeat (LRR) protein|nr:hypothetical protein [Oscillospiraceae bacterium]
MKKFVSAFLFLLILAALGLAGLRWGPGLLYDYHEGRAEYALNAEDGARAAEHLLWMLTRRPEDTDLRLRTVDAYLSLGNYTRAEYLLVKGMEVQAGQLALYTKLCAVYVAQDKLSDAVSLLNDPSNPFIAEELARLRPRPPTLSPAPGTYQQQVDLVPENGADTFCYLRLDGNIPSVADGPCAEIIPLPAGESRVRAVAVDRDGLVSDWVEGVYRLENVVQPVTFSDPILEAHFRMLLDKPVDPIMSSELWEIDALVLENNADYQSLEDLVFLPSLTRLTLRGHGQRLDLSPLSALTKLSELSLRHVRLAPEDLERIAEKTSLTVLDLQDTYLASLDMVTPLTGLTSLYVHGNSITDLTPLADLTALRTLDISLNAVGDSAPLAGLSGLQTLLASDNLIADLRGLRPLRALETVDLTRNQVEDLAPLADHDQLATLLCNGNQITSIEPLAGLPALSALHIEDNEVETLSALSGCPALQTLRAEGNPANDAPSLGTEPSPEG